MKKSPKYYDKNHDIVNSAVKWNVDAKMLTEKQIEILKQLKDVMILQTDPMVVILTRINGDPLFDDVNKHFNICIKRDYGNEIVLNISLAPETKQRVEEILSPAKKTSLTDDAYRTLIEFRNRLVSDYKILGNIDYFELSGDIKYDRQFFDKMGHYLNYSIAINKDLRRDKQCVQITLDIKHKQQVIKLMEITLDEKQIDALKSVKNATDIKIIDSPYGKTKMLSFYMDEAAVIKIANNFNSQSKSKEDDKYEVNITLPMKLLKEAEKILESELTFINSTDYEATWTNFYSGDDLNETYAEYKTPPNRLVAFIRHDVLTYGLVIKEDDTHVWIDIQTNIVSDLKKNVVNITTKDVEHIHKANEIKEKIKNADK